MASHRAELGALRAARERIEAVLARAGNSAAALGIATGALDRIARMEGLVAAGCIGPADMAALANVLTAAQSIVTALEAASSATAAHAAEQLAAASDEARTTVRAVIAGMHDFDGQLRFASSDDQHAYRDLEAERRAYIAQQPNTPAGNLNASGAAIGQMADAHALGATGPEFNQRVTELVGTTEKLRGSVIRAGGSTEEFDNRLRSDLRRIMKAKGMNDIEVDAKFASDPSPFAAMKAYLTDQDVATVKRQIDVELLQTQPPPILTTSDDTSVANSVADPFAKLRSAGIAVSDHVLGADYAHGVTATANKPIPSRGVY